MASSNTLEEQVTCAVCFEIYRNPHALPCLHTFCLACIEQIQRGTQVPCPECRQVAYITRIKNDFKTQGFVDLYYNQKESQLDNAAAQVIQRQNSRNRGSLLKPTGDVTAMCGMCNEKKNVIKSKCVECKQFMCESCDVTHSGIPVCQSHQVISRDQAVTGIQLSLQQTIATLQNDKEAIAKRSRDIAAKVKDVTNSKEQQMAEVNKVTDDFIKELDDNRNGVLHIIKAANNTVVNDLNAKKEIFDDGETEIKEKIDFLAQLVTSDDVSTLTETAKIVDEIIKSDIRKLKESFPVVNLDAGSPIYVQKGRKLDPQAFVKVQFRNKTENNKKNTSQVSPIHLNNYFSSENEGIEVNTQQYVKLLHNSYNWERSISLSFFPQRLCTINNKIWVTGWDGLYIFNTNCQMGKSIQHKEMKMARGIVKAHTNEIFVACDGNNGGIIRLDPNGKFIEKLVIGSFNDICAYKQHLYALDGTRGNIVVFQYRDPNWIQHKIFNNLHSCDRLSVNCDSLYLSSRGNCQLNVYNLEGQLMYTAGEKGRSGRAGKLNRPLLCDVNNAGENIIRLYTVTY